MRGISDRNVRGCGIELVSKRIYTTQMAAEAAMARDRDAKRARQERKKRM